MNLLNASLLLLFVVTAACLGGANTVHVRVPNLTKLAAPAAHAASTTTSTCAPATSFGAIGDGKTPADVPLAKALAACARLGGGRVSLTGGTLPANGESVFALNAPVQLLSNVVLVVDASAALQFGWTNNQSSSWPTVPSLPSYGPPGGKRSMALVYGDNVTDAGVAGEGTIDGDGSWWWNQHSDNGDNGVGRMFLLECVNCKRFTLEDVTVQNSPSWTVHLWNSEQIMVDGLRVRNPPKAPNTDGMDLDSCKDVTVRNCDITTSDDHIAIKSGMNAYGRAFAVASQNITIEDCKFGIGAGVAVGTEMSGGVHDVLVRRCSFGLGAHSAVRIKSARGRGGLMDNITFEDIHVDGVDVAVTIDMQYKAGPVENATDPGTPHMGRLTVRRLSGASILAGELNCLDESPCKDIVLEDVKTVGVKGWTCENAAGIATGVFPHPSCLNKP